MEQFEKLLKLVNERLYMHYAIGHLEQAENLLDMENAKMVKEVKEKLQEKEMILFDEIEKERVKFSAEEIENFRLLYPSGL